MVLGSIGVARAQSVQELLTFRFLQAMGASPGTSVGFGVIGDIYRLEERGRAMGSYYGVSGIPNGNDSCLNTTISYQATLLGLALAPVIGGMLHKLLKSELAEVLVFRFLCISFLLESFTYLPCRFCIGGIHMCVVLLS
jgi:MFS family permease